MERTLDPNTWYNERELEFTPNHFVVARTELTTESRLWILNTLRGRFSVTAKHDEDVFVSLVIVNSVYGYPAFEDPKEAMMYELTWS